MQISDEEAFTKLVQIKDMKVGKIETIQNIIFGQKVSIKFCF